MDFSIVFWEFRNYFQLGCWSIQSRRLQLKINPRKGFAMNFHIPCVENTLFWSNTWIYIRVEISEAVSAPRGLSRPFVANIDEL